MDRLTPIFDLGVAEAYAILTGRLAIAHSSLPPLEALENEDWGRDLLLGRFLDFAPEILAREGLTLEPQDV